MNGNRSKIAILGGSGFLGRSLTGALLDGAEQIIVLSRRARSEEFSSFSRKVRVVGYGYERSPESRRILRETVADCSVVFNLSGSSGAVASNQDPLASLEDNCARQLEFLEACRDAGTCPHVVFASSRLVYGKPDLIPVDENQPLRPGSVYAAHKLAVENYHQIYAEQGAISFTICRISVCYGDDRQTGVKNHGYLNTLIQKARRGEPLEIFGDGEQLRDYIHVRDLAAALVSCGGPRTRNEIVNVGSGEYLRFSEAVMIIAAAARVRVVHVPWPKSHLQVETGDYVTNIQKLVRLTGFRPTLPFKDGINEEFVRSPLPAATAAVGTVR